MPFHSWGTSAKPTLGKDFFGVAETIAPNLRQAPYSELINLTLVEAHTLSEWPKLDSLDGDTSATLGP